MYRIVPCHIDSRSIPIKNSHAVQQVVALGLLVDDGVDADGGLTSLTVTDNQLTLSAADGDQSVDGLEAGLGEEFQRHVSRGKRAVMGGGKKDGGERGREETFNTIAIRGQMMPQTLPGTY